MKFDRSYVILCFFLAAALITSCATPSKPIDNSLPADESTPAPPATPAVTFPGLKLEWTETTRSPVALYESQGLAAEGKLYVFGGYYNTQIQATKRSFTFDPVAGQWLMRTAMPQAVTHAGQAFYDGKIYLAGGFVGAHPGPATDHVWVYEISSDTWSAGPPLPEKVGAGALVELGGKLHFFGGTVRQGGTYLYDSTDHWILDLAAGSTNWTEAAPMPDPRNHIAGATAGGKIYAIGGQLLGDEDYGNQKIVNVYDPTSDSWSRAADLPLPLGHISAGTFAYAGRVMVIMGVTRERQKVTDILAYNPEADRWDNLTSMPGGRSATVAGVIDGQIVLATGNVAGDPLDTTWIGRWQD